MNTSSCVTVQSNSGPTFDFVRLSKSKDAVDLAPNTVRKYHGEGLPFYQKKGERAVWFSRTELAAFIRQHKVAA